MALPASVSTLLDRLTAEGYTDNPTARSDAETRGIPLNHNGTYEVLAAVSKGTTTIVIERNTMPTEPGSESITTMEPVARITGAKGALGARVADPDAVLAAAADLS